MSLDNLSDDDLIAISQNKFDDLSDDGLLALTSLKQKRKTTLTENVGISLNQAAQPFVKAAGLLGGGLASAVGATDTADTIYKKMEDQISSMDEYWNPKDAEQSFGGKLQGMGMTLPAQMMAMMASPFDTGQSAIKAGETLPTALAATGIDTIGNTVGIGLPGSVGKGMLKQAVSGAGINAAQDLATRAAISGISDTKEMKKKFEPTAESATIAGMLGVGFGVRNSLDGGSQITAGKGKYDTKKPTVEEPTYDIKATTDVDNQIAVRMANIRAIEEQLARQRNPESEYANKLREDLVSQTYTLTQLQAYKGEDVNLVPDNTPKTDVEAPRIDDQLLVEYSTRESELKALESEYRTITSKGAALTSEEKTRLADIQTRYEEVSNYLEQNMAKVHGEEPEVRQEQVTEPEVSTEFKPLPDRVSVNEAVMTRDYSNFSTDTLGKMLDNKQRKIDEVYQSVLDHGLGSPEGQRAFAFLDTLKEEYAKIESEYNKKFNQQQKSDYDFNQTAIDKASWELREPMLQAVTERGVRGGLEFLASNRNDTSLTPYGRYLGELAAKLLDNPLVGTGKFINDPNFPHAGGFDNISGYVHMKGDWTSSPGVFLHEVVHSAVNKALALFDKGQLTDPRQVKATRNIKNLYNSIRLDKNKIDTIKRFLGETDTKIVMENTREFVAYGLSDQKFQLALSRIKLEGQSGFSKLTNAIKNLMNLNKNERTALDDVLQFGEHLLDTSDGLPPGFNPNQKMDYHRMHTPQDVLAAIKSGSLRIFAHGFTQNLRQMMRHNPYFSKMEASVTKAERAKEYLIRDINHGLDAIRDWRKEGKWFYKTTGSEHDTALVPALNKISDGSKIYDVYSTLMDGYRNGMDSKETIEANKGSWSPEQLRLANSIDRATTKLWESSVKMLASKDLDYTKLKQRIGYMLTSRIGNHAMTVHVNGVLVRQQHFLTSKEAKYWADKYRSQNPDQRVVISTAEVADLREGKATQNLKDFIDSISGKSGKELEESISALEKVMSQEENANIGSHTLKSNIVGGFIGDQIGMSKRAMGEQLRDAIPRMVDSYAQNIMSRSVQKDYIDFLIDNEHKMDPTTKDILGFYIQTQIGLPYPKGGISEAMKITSDRVREAIDVGVDSIFGYHNRDKHAIDRFMGLFGNAFYISNILMKPAIWVAQPLQALNSLRSAFKEGETPRQVMAAFGETLAQLSLGKKFISKDPELERAIYKAGQETNVLHPQMVNEYNDMRIGADPDSVLNKTIDTITGKKISAWGDRGSRYASFLFFYNLHKRSGLKGDELVRVASRDATENMVAYGSKKLPAIYRELGIVGEQGATLATFAHTQLGNLIVDLKEFAQQPNASSAAPLIMTAGVTMILGGAVSMPILAEYELLRQLGLSMGWWTVDRWPNLSELIMDHAPRWVSMGALSDMTEIDMDASMRYTSLINKIADIEKNGILAFAPHLAWGKDVVANSWSSISPSSTVPERDQALKKVLPKGPVSGVIDQTRNNWDMFDNSGPLYTRMGKRGQGGVERDLAAKLAPWVGSQTTKQAMDTRKQLASKERQDQAKALLEKSVQYIVHGDKERGVAAFEKLVTKYYGGDAYKLEDAVETQIANMNRPGLFGIYFNAKTGQSTPEQQAAIVRDNLGEYLKRREGK